MTSDRIFGFQPGPFGGLLDGNQSALNPEGPGAREIAELSWLLFAGGAAIFTAVLALALYAIVAPRGHRVWMAGNGFVVAAGIVFPLVVLTVLLAGVLLSGAKAEHRAAATLRIEVIGQQWWWRVHYLDADGGHEFATANEIRIPAGQPVELWLRSADVIHSLWVPNLAAKLDLIPGRVNRLLLAADRPGEFRGQCAEYCGGPHAWMALYVVAMRPDEFEAWRMNQRRPAIVPATPLAERGRTLFVAHGCALCHVVRGNVDGGVRGPDLTHVGGRISIGAGRLRNDAGSLADWIAASQHLKPDNLMPSFDMIASNEIAAIAAYLASLR